jgi:hypothetical protein
MSLKTHLNVLETSAEEYAELPAFQLPDRSSTSTELQLWRPISYSQFRHDVETHAKYWARQLNTGGFPRRSVVGLWCVYSFTTA